MSKWASRVIRPTSARGRPEARTAARDGVVAAYDERKRLIGKACGDRFPDGVGRLFDGQSLKLDVTAVADGREDGSSHFHVVAADAPESLAQALGRLVAPAGGYRSDGERRSDKSDRNSVTVFDQKLGKIGPGVHGFALTGALA